MPARELVSAHLQPLRDKSTLLDTEFTLALFEHATGIASEAVAGCGVGVDHYTGEHVLAAALGRETPRGYEHRLCLAITDRRTILSGWSSIKGGHNGTGFSMGHEQLARVESKATMLANYVRLFDHQGTSRDLTFPQVTDVLGRFYAALAQLPPQARMSAPLPMPQPSPEDPAGLRAVAHGLWREDPAATQILAHVDRLVYGGQVDPASGYDFACRVFLAHRSAVSGPAMSPGLGRVWLSPMSAADLGHTFVSIYGRPADYQVAPDGWAWHDFHLNPERDYLDATLSALGVAAYIGLGVGFSPGRVIAHHLMKREPITKLRVGVHEGQACSHYVVDGPRGRLELSDANMAHRLHQALIHSSYRVLERRALLGWGVDYHALFA